MEQNQPKEIVEADNQPTREQMCEDLARAIFPNHEVLISANGVEILPPTGSGLGTWRVFDPFESAADSRSLVMWIATQSTQIKRRFLCHLSPELSDACVFNDAPMNEDMIFAALTAPLPVIAEAAWRVIQEKQ